MPKKKKQNKRRLAALKGWRTRARNKRRLAALKGWRTRREREAIPAPETAEEYEQMYDDFNDYEDQGEVDTSPDYEG